MQFDAYVASDFMWAAAAARHAAASRCSTASAASTGSTRRPTSMREWDRLFFVNERRLRNFVTAGAIDADSPAIRLVGYAEGRLPRQRHLDTASRSSTSLGLDPARPTVLYAPTWSPASSLNAMGVELIRRLLRIAGQPDRQAARSLARPARALLRRRRLGGARSQPLLRPTARRDRAGARHLPVPRRGRPDDHRPQLGRLRVPAARPADRPHPPAGADPSSPTSTPTTSSCSRRSRSRSTTVDEALARRRARPGRSRRAQR